MATIVQISKTNHLSFSPMNEKHNILYHRARQNVNQRHIQKPWFDMHPFIDKDDDKGIDLDAYRPENDRGIVALESLTIVEDYFSDKPLLTREFKIGEFWDFLFSDDWVDGYSLRILEGRLQNLLYTCLLAMTQSGRVVQHSTRAFAKNRRKRYSIYKLSTKPPELGRYEETLLLEFIYYGHMVETSSIEDTGSSLGYPQATTCSTVTTVSSDLESSDQDCKAVDGCIPRSELRPAPPNMPIPHGPSRRLLQRRARAPCEPRADRGDNIINKSLSRVQGAEHSVAMIPRGTRKQEHRSDFSTGSEDWPYVPHKLDLSKFMCTEKVAYLGEFELSDDSSSSSEEDEVEYGQELYIGDRGVRALESPVPIESVETKLKRRKGEVKKRREERRHMLEELKKPPKPLMPEFSLLDIKKYLPEASLEEQRDKENTDQEKVPDLVEFINMMKEDDKHDPRLRHRSKMRALKFMQKYNLNSVKPANEWFADQVGGVTDSQACKLHCYGTDSMWQVMSEDKRKRFLAQKLNAAGANIQLKPKKKIRRDRRMRRKLEIPMIYITTVSQVTYLHPVSRALLQAKLAAGAMKRFKQPGITTRRRLPLLPEQTALMAEMNKKRRSTEGNHAQSPESRTRSPDTRNSGKMFPKAKPLVTGTESPDLVEADEESDGLEASPFDTNKLQIQYSMERINKKKAEKKKKELPQFYQVLKKYYRMQSIFKAMGSSDRRKTSSGCGGSIFGLPSAKPKPRMLGNLFKSQTKEKHNVTVGKMRWFPFLDAKRKLVQPEEDNDEPLFENYPMDVFRRNLQRALEEFVVRREVVISDYNAKASVSFTLTKKSVFLRSKAHQL